MKVIQLLWFSLYLIIFTTVIYSQDNSGSSGQLTLQEAVDVAFANHPVLRIQQTYVDQAIGEKQIAGAIPNPTISYYRENLDFADANIGEWILDAGMPVNFLWERWSQTASAGAQVKAQEFLLNNRQRILKFEIQQAYVHFLFSDQMSATWQDVITILENSVSAAEARFADGDISNYELQRIKMEQLRYMQAALDAERDRLSRRRQLAFLIDPQKPEPDFDSVQELHFETLAINPDDLIQASTQHRPDIIAAGWLLQSRESQLTSEKWKRLPEINLKYGYKEQSDNYAGSVVQLSVGIPLFNRNQGNIRQTAAEKDRQSLTLNMLEEQAQSETRLAIEAFRVYAAKYPHFARTDDQTLKETLSAAVASYQEGEMSLIELLDAVQAYVEVIRIRNQFFSSYYISIFEIQKASGVSITGF